MPGGGEVHVPAAKKSRVWAVALANATPAEDETAACSRTGRARAPVATAAEVALKAHPSTKEPEASACVPKCF